MTHRRYRLDINGEMVAFDLAPDTPLLYVLRNDCGLNGPKFGCGLGECGACVVLVDGRAVRACATKIGTLEGRSVTTLEGLATDGRPHPVQQAFVEMQAAQCGYCLNGMIMATVALLTRNPKASEAEIRQALSRQLCRCGTHMEILAAVRRARDLMASGVEQDSVQEKRP
ncbi:(2Fe-2S)-binding protein [Rhizobium halophytocola]|uniref:Nicotinate dehydrogenase subunit A n=1 Tax=Rhizobium halophytocola TaxID=735519 RepID=A0ABS4DU09_9HYPH|nr:(2Fe-2S)-binding protein [Rhizobium halophytocola]MBP1849188.1 nicotinate dehydrogenase subunit A [Rhizobium halophytocola]